MGFEKIWLQFISLLIFVIWISYYWIRRRVDWQRKRQMPVLLCVSLLLSPYSWTYDQILLIISILVAAEGLLYRGWRLSTLLWLGSISFINILVLFLHRYNTNECFIWLGPVYFLWYWLATKHRTDKFVPITGE